MLNPINTTVPTLSRSLLAPLNLADTYSLTSTNKNSFQTNTNLNATANPSQTLYQPHAPTNTGLSAILLSSSSAMSSINPPLAFTQNYTVPYVSMSKSVKAFGRLDHQYTPEEYFEGRVWYFW